MRFTALTAIVVWGLVDCLGCASDIHPKEQADGLNTASASSSEAGQAAERPKPLLEEEVIMLPGPVEAISAAGAGRYIVMRLGGVPGLAVFDTFDRENVDLIRLPSEDFRFAAGGDCAVVYFKENNILQAWNLRTLEKGKTKPNPMSGLITNMIMGHARGDQVIIHCPSGSGGRSGNANVILDTATLEPIGGNGTPNTFGARGAAHRDHVHWRCNHDLEYLTEWSTSGSPRGIGVYCLRAGKYQNKYKHDTAGDLVMGDDDRIYASNGDVYNTSLVRVFSLRGQKLYPGLGGSLVLGVSTNGRLTIYEPGKTTPVGPWGVFPGWKQPDHPAHTSVGGLAIDRRLIFAPNLGWAAFVPIQNDRIVLRPFDLKATLDEHGIDYLVVTSAPPNVATAGQPWTYQIEVLSKAGGVKYEVELAPDGLTVSDLGLMTWTPAPGEETRAEKIIVLISDEGGEQTYHSFAVRVPAARQ